MKLPEKLVRFTSYNHCQMIFFARIFGAESKSFDHQPDGVCDTIIRKCGGIPLAIITMASLLVGKPREEWLDTTGDHEFAVCPRHTAKNR